VAHERRPPNRDDNIYRPEISKAEQAADEELIATPNDYDLFLAHSHVQLSNQLGRLCRSRRLSWTRGTRARREVDSAVASDGFEHVDDRLTLALRQKDRLEPGSAR
jgi:hypothetical protein